LQRLLALITTLTSIALHLAKTYILCKVLISEMKTLLLIANQIPHYRVSVYNYLARRFCEEGWMMKVASNRMLRESQIKLLFEFHELPFNFAKYRSLVDKLKPEVVILHLHLKLPIFWALAYWLQLKNIPLISWTKGANLDQPRSRFRYEVFNHAHRLSNALLMYSPMEASFIKPKHRGKIFVARNAVNSEDFPVLQGTKDRIKLEFDIPFEKVVLFVGTMGGSLDRKRVLHLIEIFSQLVRPNVGLVLVGSGMTGEAQAKVNPRNTRVLGAIHDSSNIKISKLFKAADVYVVPGHVGLGINQAFFWGLPVVTEACNQPPEIHYLKSGRNGFIVPDNDLSGLRDRMLYLLDNDVVRAEYAWNARQDIRRDASIDGMYQSFLEAVKFVCRRRKSAAVEKCEYMSVS
jgi:glycosyltransferase involved in cell wall biosynthesis